MTLLSQEMQAAPPDGLPVHSETHPETMANPIPKYVFLDCVPGGTWCRQWKKMQEVGLEPPSMDFCVSLLDESEI